MGTITIYFVPTFDFLRDKKHVDLTAHILLRRLNRAPHIRKTMRPKHIENLFGTTTQSQITKIARRNLAR